MLYHGRLGKILVLCQLLMSHGNELQVRPFFGGSCQKADHQILLYTKSFNFQRRDGMGWVTKMMDGVGLSSFIVL